MVDRINIPGTSRVPSRQNPAASKVVKPKRISTVPPDDEEEDIPEWKKELQRLEEEERKAAAAAIAPEVATGVAAGTQGVAPTTTIAGQVPTTTIAGQVPTQPVREQIGGIKGQRPEYVGSLAEELDIMIQNEGSKIAGITGEDLEYIKRTGELPASFMRGTPEQEKKKGIFKQAFDYLLPRILSPMPGVSMQDLSLGKDVIVGGLYESLELVPGRELKFSTNTEIAKYKAENPKDKNTYKVGDVIPESKARWSDYYNNVFKDDKFGYGTAFARHARYQPDWVGEIPLVGGALDFGPKYSQDEYDIAMAEWEQGLLDEKPNFKPGDEKPDYVQGASTTGNKWADRTIGLVGDIVLDPVTYLTLGTGTAVQASGRALARVGAGKIGQEAIYALVDDAVKLVGDDLARNVTKDLAKNTAARIESSVVELVAREVGADVAAASARQLQTISRGLNVQTLRIIRQQVLESGDTAALKIIDKELAKAQRAYSAIAPARQFGGRAREGLAGEVLNLRDEAIIEAQKYAGTARGRLAQNFVDTITDDVIGDIATRGSSAFRGEVADALGLAGGWRFGLPKSGMAVSIPGTNRITTGYGRFYSGLRQMAGGARIPFRGPSKRVIGMERFGFAGKVPAAIRNLFTNYGRAGQLGTQDLFNARVGLRSGILKGPNAVAAVRALADDMVYKTFSAGAGRAAKARLRSLLSQVPKDKSNIYKTVYQLVQLGEEVLSRTPDEITRALADSGTAVDRAITPEEIAFAKEVLKFGRETTNATVFGIGDVVPTSAGSPAMTPEILREGWFPLVLTKQARDWLEANAGTADARRIFEALGLNPGESLTSAVRRAPRIGDAWAGGRRLTQALPNGRDISIDLLNREILENIPGFKGNFFETNVDTALAQFAQKFSDDYAFLKMLDYYNARGLPGNQTTREVLKIWQDAARASLPEGRTPLTSGALALKNIETADDLVADINQIRSVIEYIKSYSDDALNRALVEARKTGDMREAERWGSFLNSLDILRGDYDDFLKDIDDILLRGGGMRTSTGELVMFDEDMMSAVMPELLVIRDVFLGMTSTWGDLLAMNTKQLDTLLDTFSKNPNMMRTALKYLDDVYVQLDGAIEPDAMVKLQLADMYKNLQKLRDPATIKGFSSFMKNFNTFLKSYVLLTPGYHVVNQMGNTFAMIAGGAKLSNLSEGGALLSRFLLWMRNNPEKISAVRLAADPLRPTVGARDAFEYGFGGGLGAIIEEFISDPKVAAKLKPGQAELLRRTFGASGGAGLMEIEEVFSSATRPLGFFGRERKPGRFVSEAASENIVNRGAGALLQRNRDIGNLIEEFSRFTFTYDALKQGLSDEMAAIRTSTFLLDYGDLNIADEYLRQIYPFWIWMSRNLPMQIMNMATNPAPYVAYNSFRRNFEDENGKNMLVPKWMKDANQFVLTQAGPGGLPWTFRADIGIPSFPGAPGTGSQSPIQEGIMSPLQGITGIADIGPDTEIADYLKSLGSGVTPIFRVPAEAVEGSKFFSGEEFTTPTEEEAGMGTDFMQRGLYAAGQFFPPAAITGRYLGALGATAPAPRIGEETPQQRALRELLSETLGLRTTQEGVSTGELRARGIPGILGSPIRPLTEVEQNQARRDIITLLKWLQEQGFKTE